MNLDKSIKKHINIWTIIVVAMLSSITIIGIIFETISQNETIIEKIKSNSFLFLFITIAIFVVFSFVVPFFYKGIDKIRCCNRSEIKCDTLVSFQCFIKYSTVILICWLPVLIIAFPGTSMGYDYFWQTMQGIGAFPLSNHHPVFSSLVFGWLYSIGYTLFGASGGLFLTILVQALSLSMAIGLCLSVQEQLNVPKRILVIITAFVCLCPIFSTHAAWLIKDTFFASITIFFFTTIFIRIVSIHFALKIPAISSIPIIIITGFIFSIFRNGVTPVSVLMIILIPIASILNNKNNNNNIKKDVIGSIVAIICVVILLASWHYFLEYKNVCPTDKREALSLPMRQIVYTMKKRPNRITKHETKIIEQLYKDSIAKGETLKSLSQKYSDTNADPLKISFSTNKRDIKNLFSIWFSIGKRNPETYFDALIRGTIAYWWPGVDSSYVAHAIPWSLIEDDFANDIIINRRIDTMFIPTIKSFEYNNIKTNQTVGEHLKGNSKAIDMIHSSTSFLHLKKKVGSIYDCLIKTPVITILFKPGLYFCIVIFCLGYLFSRKLDGRFMFPVLAFSFMAMLSPINGYMRYVLQFDIMSILMIGMCFVCIKTSSD